MTGDTRPIRLLVAAALIATAGIVVVRSSEAERIPPREPFSAFPFEFETWRGEPGAELDAQTLAVLGADEYLTRIYAGSDRAPVDFYVGYYESQRQGDLIHSPMNCLPGSGWEPVQTGRIMVPLGGPEPQTLELNRFVIQKGEYRQIVLYWYQSHGRAVASEYTSRMHMVIDAVRLNRTDAALVRVVTPIDPRRGGEAAAERRAVAFVRDMYPRLANHLPV
jgi:EpsI family protein